MLMLWYFITSRGHQDAVISQKSVIQLACAVLETLESPSNRHWDQLASIEKVGLGLSICLYFGKACSIENTHIGIFSDLLVFSTSEVVQLILSRLDA
jgi:hypothetical protein